MLVYKNKKLKSGAFIFIIVVSSVINTGKLSGQINIFEPGTSKLNLKNVEASDTSLTDLNETYQTIKEMTVSENKKWSKKLFSAIVKKPEPPIDSDQKGPIIREFQAYEGKTIRNINIIILAPFGTNINHIDSVNNENNFNNTVNRLHVKTKEVVIRNNLSFHPGNRVNPKIIAETETFLRNTGYISDARITISQVPLAPDLADITVTVRDVWSIGASIHNFSISSLDIELFDKNFLGSGSKVSVDLLYANKYDKKFGYGVGYLYKNFLKSFIDLQASYLDNIVSKQFSISAERPLQTSLNYFGQISYNNESLRVGIIEWDSISPDINENLSVTIGKAITLPNDLATKRLVFALRYLQKNPTYKYAIYHNYILNRKLLPYQYVKNRMWLFQASLYQQAYYREYLIHNFGVTEDVAYGYNISAQVGYSDFFSKKDGMYASLNASSGKEFTFGNIYTEAAISTFFNEKETYEGVYKAGVRYFSPLMRIKTNRLRQFINVDYTKLLSPIKYFDNEIYFSSLTNLNTNHFSEDAAGVERMMVNSETDIFSGWNIAGFRFLFYNFIDAGWITPKNNLFNSRNFFWGTGLGMRIRNDLLVFKTIDFKIGFYPRFNQHSLGEYFNASTTNPAISPNFVPTYPQEISLE